MAREWYPPFPPSRPLGALVAPMWAAPLHLPGTQWLCDWLTTTNGFTKRGIKIECASSASAIRGISFQLAVLVDVTACLPTDPASCNDNAAGEGGASDVLLAPGVTIKCIDNLGIPRLANRAAVTNLLSMASAPAKVPRLLMQTVKMDGKSGS